MDWTTEFVCGTNGF